MTSVIAGVMAVSGVLVVLGGILNSASVVAIFSGVVGKQDGGWYGIVALLLGLTVIAVFVYAYRQSIWNWWIRSALIALSAGIFLVSAIGMADNLRASFEGGGYHWTEGINTPQEKTIRIVPETFAVIDVDFVVVMMLIGSIGIAAVALWGAFRWESAKIEESQNEEIRGLLDELPPEVLREGGGIGAGLERYYGDPSRPPSPPLPSASYRSLLAEEAAAGEAEAEAFPDEPVAPYTLDDRYYLLPKDEAAGGEPLPESTPDDPVSSVPPGGGYRSVLAAEGSADNPDIPQEEAPSSDDDASISYRSLLKEEEKKEE